MLLSYEKTPIQEIKDAVTTEFGIRLLVKREDLNHSEISGNKWWKLKYNIAEARRLNCKTVLTFGGAYSNHIFATAAAAHEAGLKSIGIIRGEETFPLNETLTFAIGKGMELHYVSRENYRHKTEAVFLDYLHEKFGDFFLIPEGGTNTLAVKGVAEFASEFLSEIDCDYVCLPVGTCGTLAGIIKGLAGRKKILGFSSLKGGEFLQQETDSLLKQELINFNNWKIITEYHFGGYGKTTNELMNFIQQHLDMHALPLDKIYTSKMMFGIYEEIKKGNIKRDSTVLMIHTGGLQTKNLEN